MRYITISILILLSLIGCINVYAQSDDYLIGMYHGEQDSKANPVFFVAGAGCGCFGIGFAYLNKPSVNILTLTGKSEVYIIGYTKGYQNKSRNKNMIYASVGWLFWLAFYYIILNSTP